VLVLKRITTTALRTRRLLELLGRVHALRKVPVIDRSLEQPTPRTYRVVPRAMSVRAADGSLGRLAPGRAVLRPPLCPRRDDSQRYFEVGGQDLVRPHCTHADPRAPIRTHQARVAVDE